MNSYRCPVCDYVFDELLGHPREGFPAGTPWESVPDDWTCPDCGVREKVDFEPIAPAGGAPWGARMKGAGGGADEAPVAVAADTSRAQWRRKHHVRRAADTIRSVIRSSMPSVVSKSWVG
ncbi:MAG: hypothetical protein QOH56_1664 [Pseudonocardiales bacterium]|nr:hypothetical protein [Pseudonocardiales bacterium]